jgi:diguanylate cyclase (GGDEF)-like protein
MAEYDILTGLPNRSLLRDRLHHAMVQTKRRGNVLAVVCLDLDNFKAVNDDRGHAAGDGILTTIAHRMKLTMRQQDTLSRLGGDEFVAVLLDVDNPDESLPKIRHLLEVASQPVSVAGEYIRLSASAGVAFYPQSEDVDPDQLQRQAGQALYQSKLQGKNRYHIFDSGLDLSVRSHHEDLERVRTALTRNEFVLFYQPKMNLASGAIHGAEALIRWNHPERGLLLPSQFLPIVEGHPLALEIGEWVITNVLQQIEIWNAADLDIAVSVNISAQQLQHSDFSARLHAILSAHRGVDPSRLEIEVLESTALPDMAQVSQVIHTCGKLGVSFALDDFGTGYSSLAYLKRLPVDVLKIDQTFVHDMLDDPEDLTIVEGMLGLASAFRREAIAEGVETVEQGILLLRLGCKIAQGFGIAAPMPAGDLPGWLASWKPDPQWLKISALDPADRSLLYASAEHTAWVSAIEALLHGTRRVPPSREATQCRLGSWMTADSPGTADRKTRFREVASVHTELHICGTEIIACSNRDRIEEALERLPELHRLRDRLLSELRVLLQ